MTLALPVALLRRRLVAGLACSLLLHLSLVALGLWARSWAPPVVVKKGEPLFVELPAEKPEEPAPRGALRPPAEPRLRPGLPAARPPVKDDKPKSSGPKVESAKAAPAVDASRPVAPQPAPAPAPEPVQVPEPTQVAKAVPPPEPERPTPLPSEPGGEKPSAGPAPPAAEAGEPKVAVSGPKGDLVAGLPPERESGIRGEGGGLRSGRGGIEGEPIPLDTPDPRYTDYFEKVRRRIKANWIYPREAGERGIGGHLVIAFAIAKNGHLQAVELRRSSGVSVLDLYALNAVKLAQPFPPVPDSVARDVLPIQGIFTYQIVDASLLNQYLR